MKNTNKEQTETIIEKYITEFRKEFSYHDDGTPMLDWDISDVMKTTKIDKLERLEALKSSLVGKENKR